MLHIDRLGSDVNRVDRLLRSAEEAPNDERDQRYRETADAARRAFERLLGDPQLDPAILEVAEAATRLHESAAVVLAMRSAYRAFLAAEYRLLVDHGIDRETALPLVEELADLREWRAREVATAERLRAALEALGDEFKHLVEGGAAAQSPKRWHRSLWRAVLALGGAFVIGADQLVGDGLAASTGGLSVVGAEISKVGGGLLIAKAAERPTGARARPDQGRFRPTDELPPHESLGDVVV